MAEDTAASTAPAASTTKVSIGDSGAASVVVKVDIVAEEVKPEVAGDDTTEKHAVSGKIPVAISVSITRYG